MTVKRIESKSLGEQFTDFSLNVRYTHLHEDDPRYVVSPLSGNPNTLILTPRVPHGPFSEVKATVHTNDGRSHCDALSMSTGDKPIKAEDVSIGVSQTFNLVDETAEIQTEVKISNVSQMEGAIHLTHTVSQKEGNEPSEDYEILYHPTANELKKIGSTGEGVQAIVRYNLLETKWELTGDGENQDVTELIKQNISGIAHFAFFKSTSSLFLDYDGNKYIYITLPSGPMASGPMECVEDEALVLPVSIKVDDQEVLQTVRRDQLERYMHAISSTAFPSRLKWPDQNYAFLNTFKYTKKRPHEHSTEAITVEGPRDSRSLVDVTQDFVSEDEAVTLHSHYRAQGTEATLSSDLKIKSPFVKEEACELKLETTVSNTGEVKHALIFLLSESAEKQLRKCEGYKNLMTVNGELRSRDNATIEWSAEHKSFVVGSFKNPAQFSLKVVSLDEICDAFGIRVTMVNTTDPSFPLSWKIGDVSYQAGISADSVNKKPNDCIFKGSGPLTPLSVRMTKKGEEAVQLF